MHSLWHKCRPLYQRREFRLLFVLNLLLGLGYSFVVPFMSMFGTLECKMDEFTFGLFMTATAVGGIVLGTWVAHYSDTHWSRRTLLLVGSVAGALGYIAYAHLRHVGALVTVGTLVIGLSTITFSQLFAYAKELLGASGLPASQAAFYMNAFRMFFALAWTIGPALAAWVMVHFSFNGLFYAAAGNFVLFALVVAVAVPPTPPSSAARRPAAPLWQLLRRRDLAAHFAAFVLVAAASTIGMMNLPLLLLQELRGTPADVGWAYSIAPIFEVPFMLYFGWLATRRPTDQIIRWGIVIALAYYALLSLVGAPWQVFIAQIGAAAATAVVSGVAITYFQNHLPDHPGAATNLYSTASRAGSTLGYFLFGALAWRWDHRQIFIACAAFALLARLLMAVESEKKAAEPQLAAAS